MPVLVRYWLFQIPELVVVATAGAALVRFDFLAWHWALAVFAACVAKDALMYPWVRSAFGVQASAMVGPERLLGARGVATEDLSPEGFVRVSAELWRARTQDGASLAKGTPVRVESVHGLRLVVSRAAERS